jgi:aerobic carbon-monoxide dehydrogenase small subunit
VELIMMRKIEINLRVNGRKYSSFAEPRKTLLDFLREDLGLTGTHAGCEHGVCGACTVLFNGDTTRACLTLAVQAEGADIMTVEGLAKPGGELHPLQTAFQTEHGLQCGYCTPAMLITAYALLKSQPNPSEETIREEISANICRCTGYAGIIRAVQRAAKQMQPK